MKSPWIHVLGDRRADPELQKIYDESRDPNGSVDNILIIHSLDPDSLRAHLAVYRNAMRGSRDLPKVQREMIAVVVSAANRCHY